MTSSGDDRKGRTMASRRFAQLEERARGFISSEDSIGAFDGMMNYLGEQGLTPEQRLVVAVFIGIRDARIDMERIVSK